MHHILKYLFNYQVDQIIIPYGYKGETIKNYISKNYKNKKIKCFNAGKNTSIIDRIKKSIKFIEEEKKIVVIMNGDSIYKFNLKNLINKEIIKGKIFINLICTNLLVNFGFVKKSKSGKRISFNYKNGNFKSFNDNYENKNYFYSGMCAIKKEVLIKHIDNIKNNFEVELFNKISMTGKLGFVFDNNLFLQVNTHEDLKNLDGNKKKK